MPLAAMWLTPRVSVCLTSSSQNFTDFPEPGVVDRCVDVFRTGLVTENFVAVAAGDVVSSAPKSSFMRLALRSLTTLSCDDTEAAGDPKEGLKNKRIRYLMLSYNILVIFTNKEIRCCKENISCNNIFDLNKLNRSFRRCCMIQCIGRLKVITKLSLLQPLY